MTNYLMVETLAGEDLTEPNRICINYLIKVIYENRSIISLFS